ncbi:hypothetical protein JCM19237_1872 [Photobacterium aphoticum]|uniref:Uncharacterized protein n=1 Tax=Photobacterium aphoticum TaxID=754436 RepID=A0A090RF87_9GAMM|nr:hypothetical protein JCM19237_1872 [Photobacterium aphoticum]
MWSSHWPSHNPSKPIFFITYHYMLGYARCVVARQFSDGFGIQPLENGHTHYQTGDLYRFTLTATANGTAQLQRALTALQHLPRSADALPRTAVFQQNLRCHRIQCYFTGHDVTQLEDCTPFGLDALAEYVAFWQEQDQCQLRCTTPMRLKNGLSS